MNAKICEMDKSVLILKPKPAFFAWLGAMAKVHDLDFEKFYFSEQNSVFLIPALDDDLALLTFVDQIKPMLLKHSIAGYGFGPLQEYSKEAFDNFFEIELRDRAVLVENAG